MGSIAALGSLSWSDVLRLRAAAPARDLSIIHLFLAGGLSHLDTFDMKLNGDAKYRGPFKAISTSVAGLQVCEHCQRCWRRRLGLLS
jgi:hypothetical protein